MDWLAVVAVLVAVAASFAEFLSRNQQRVFRDLFNRYLLFYLGINALFAFLTYHFLPDIAHLVLKKENAGWATAGWGRVFVAAFGYLVIVRTKFLTIGDTPIGIDAIYNQFASYSLRHTNILIQNKQNAVLEAVYAEHKELKRYQHALTDRLSDAPKDELATIQAQMEALNNSALPEHIKCKRLAGLLLRIVGTRAELEAALRNVPNGALQ